LIKRIDKLKFNVITVYTVMVIEAHFSFECVKLIEVVISCSEDDD